MEVKKTKINGVFLIKPQVFKDNRGHFFENNEKNQRKCVHHAVDMLNLLSGSCVAGMTQLFRTNRKSTTKHSSNYDV